MMTAAVPPSSAAASFRIPPHLHPRVTPFRITRVCCSSTIPLPPTDKTLKVSRGVGNSDKQITRVLFCGLDFPDSYIYTRKHLEEHPFVQVEAVHYDDVPDVIEKYQICVVKKMRLSSNIISRAKQMKVVMQFGVGLEGVDIDAATKYGIKVASIPSDKTGNAQSCGEMAIYLMLGLLRRQNDMLSSLKLKRLGEPIGDTLLGKTVFILGYGRLGTEVAKRLRSFGVKIIATKRSWALESQASYQSSGCTVQDATIYDLVDEKGSHEEIYRFAGSADIVVCCLTMNKETVGIVNDSFISSMKKGSLLVNIARGGLLDYEAVVRHLESGHLGGLGTDVTWTEPFNPEDPLLRFSNVIVTPHVAGVTKPSYASMSKVVADVALQLHAGNPLRGIEVVN